ncbi:MAG: ORF6N domain-containing protein [Ruminococcus sp.]|nr:ORF6N domain-containing protein [Ruminococcus sp.]
MYELINGVQIKVKEYMGQRVLTTAQLAEAYDTTEKIISQNFNRNKDRYIEGVHFYRLTGEALKKFKTNPQFEESSIRVKVLYLWTERGALHHAKSLNTDKAWEVYEFLVDNYFRTRNIPEFSNDELIQRLVNEINALNERLDMHEKNSVIRIDNAIKSIEKSVTDNLYDSIQTIVPGFAVLYKKINKILYSNYNKYNKNKKKK